MQTDFGRGIRLDERSSLTISAPVLDITVVESARTAAEFAAATEPAAAVSVFSLVRSELQRLKFTNPDKKYIAWFDFGDPRFCGQATLYTDPRRVPDNYNQLSSLAIIYAPGNRNNSSGGFCRSGTVLHELGHAFGAIQKVAPHAFDGAHCNDSENDIMCYPAISRWGADAPPLDEDPVGAAPIIARAALDELTTSGPSNPGPATATFDFNRDDYCGSRGGELASPGVVDSEPQPLLCSTEGCDKASNETGFTPVTATRRGNQR